MHLAVRQRKKTEQVLDRVTAPFHGGAIAHAEPLIRLRSPSPSNTKHVARESRVANFRSGYFRVGVDAKKCLSRQLTIQGFPRAVVCIHPTRSLLH